MGLEGSGHSEKKECARELAAFLRANQYSTSGVPHDLLEPFNDGEVVIDSGRGGGRVLVCRGDHGRKYLSWE